MGDFLCVGDHISLYCDDVFGYVFSCQSSSSNNGLYIYHKQSRKAPTEIPNPQAATFRVCIQNRYRLNKSYRNCIQASEDNPDDLSLQAAASDAKLAATAEDEDNQQESLRQTGKRVVYGQIIELRHLFTGKLVHVSTKQTSSKNKNNMKITLQEHHARHAQFKILPRYKVKSEGDVIQMEDQVVLESVKSPGQFFHASVPFQIDIFTKGCEVNLGVQQSGFTIMKTHRPSKQWNRFLKGGSVIRLFHKDVEAYLTAEGVFGDNVAEDVHLRVRRLNINKPQTLAPSTNAITYWQVESEESVLTGDVIEWQQQIRLRHMTTRKYLYVDVKGEIGLMEDGQDPKTVFRMHPFIKEHEEIEFESYTRIEHVITGRWIHAMRDTEYIRTTVSNRQDVNSMENLQWDAAKLIKICSEPQQMYNDAFTIQKVTDEHLSIFNFMAGMVLTLQNLMNEKSAGSILDHRRSQKICTAIKEMARFMIVNGVPDRNRQKLMRNLKIVNLLVKILQLPIDSEAADYTNMQSIFKAAYHVLTKYLLGDSRKNELYFARYISFFQEQFKLENELGLKAAKMITELIKDNLKIVDCITHTQIDFFIELLCKHKNYYYLDLLNVLCVCDGVAIPDIQKYITDAWLCRSKGGVYLTELGQKLGKEIDVVYMSTNDGTDWIKLMDFVDAVKNEPRSNSPVRVTKTNATSAQLRFLEHQLDLFGKLCEGRNDFAINVITQQLKYLTWEEAFLCLQNEQLPDELRAQYCQLIVGLFIDVGGSYSIVEHTKLTFLFDNKSSSDSSDKQESQISNLMQDRISVLRKWITQFLDKNKDMTASLIGHNKLVEQVLCLVYYLVMYGYYGEADDVKTLLTPLLSLLDGRNDKPVIQTHSEEFKRLLRSFHEKERYKQSPENKAIVDAKYQALKVVELILTFQFNVRLEGFVSLFKSTERSIMGRHHKFESEITPLLFTKYNPDDEPSASKRSLKTLRKMFNKTAYVNITEITSILMDLSQYEYDKMVSFSVWLLHNLYSTHQQLFDKAVQAQVVITDESIKTFRSVSKHVPVLRRLSQSKLSTEQSAMMTGIFGELTEFCHLPNEPEERHAMNQTIMVNQGLLAVIFDILSQQIDVKLLKQNSDLKAAFIQILKLLKGLAHGNHDVQMRVFDQMDTLLQVKGVEAAMAEALTEVFVGNQQTCMKILPRQVKRIVNLAAQHQESVPEFLDLLCAIVKVEELDLPLKRNQAYVMKYFMQNYDKVAQVVERHQKFRESILLRREGENQLSYLLSLVDLLATCAEGENRLVESIGQSMFSLEELLSVMNHKCVSNNLKMPYVRYFLWVYMNTAGGLTESPVSKLQHNRNIWTFLESLSSETEKLTIFVVGNKTVTSQLLKQPPAKDAMPRDDLMGYAYGTLHYLFEAVFPFLQAFFNRNFSLDVEKNPKEIQIINKLTENLLVLCDTVGPLICLSRQMKVMVTSMTAILPASTMSPKIIEGFVDKYASSAVLHQNASMNEAQQQYQQYYSDEEEINNKLNTFAKNFKLTYVGSNLVSVQLGHKSNRKYYDDIDKQLPLGEEFQQLVNCFIDATAKNLQDRYKMSNKLVQQLEISSKVKHRKEKERRGQIELDIKCLQLLRAMIHNEERMLPENWQEDLKINTSQLMRIREVQNALNHDHSVRSILQQISNLSDTVVREVLALLSTMLFNVNKAVQHSIEVFFLQTREEEFFFAVKNRMHMSAIAIKERRSLAAVYMARSKEALAQTRRLKATISGARSPLHDYGVVSDKQALVSSTNEGFTVSTENINYTGSSKLKLTDEKQAPNGSAVQNVEMSKLSVKVENSPVEIGFNEPMGDLASVEYNDEGCIELVLDILAKMCDGQYKTLQNYIREQPDNIKSVNLVAETAEFLGLLYSTINASTVDLVIQLFSTLNEFASGNQANRTVIYDHKVIDYVNFILRVAKFNDCPPSKVICLCEEIADLLNTLLEEKSPSALALAQEITTTLDKEAVIKTMVELYSTAQNQLNMKSSQASDTLPATFRYFFVVAKTLDVAKCEEQEYIKTPEQQAVWKFCKKNSTSVEILKRDNLQKVYFRVQHKNLVREDVKERMKWEVDRSSPSNKIRDLMAWSKDILTDVRYQQGIMSKSYLRFFVNNWSLWGYLCIFLSLVINVMMLISWRAPLSLNDLNSTDELPQALYDPMPVTSFAEFWYIFYVFAGFHNIFSLCLIASYFISYHPRLPTWWGIKSEFRELFGLKHQKSDEEHDDHDHYSQLAVYLISFRTFYYMVFVTMSALGTALHGYFFAFHLLHIVSINQLLDRVIKAVTLNGKSLIWVGILGVVVFYIYALTSFALLRSAMDPEEGYFCSSLWQCTVSVIRYGLIGELFETMHFIGADATFANFGLMVLFHVTFFIFITTIGLNIIFGIIVDTFSELRDIKWHAEMDMRESCFICSRSSYDFEHYGKGFEHHVKNDHNLWAYIFFFIYLDETPEKDYTALELYVYKMLQKRQYDFFPLNQALCLSGKKEDSADTKMDALLNHVVQITKKQEKEETERHRERERLKQQEWEARHRVAVMDSMDPDAQLRDVLNRRTRGQDDENKSQL